MGLDKLDKQRVALILDQGGREILVVGTGRYTQHEPLGPCLEVRLAGQGDPVFFLVEGKWRGEIHPSETDEYDYCIRPAMGHALH